MQASPTIETAHGYTLASDLARLCLPQEYKDSNRKLAWANSICFLFLVIGIVGLKPPQVVQRPLNQPMEIVPVVFTPPDEPPKTEPDVKQNEPEQPQDTTLETPQIATVVAADASAVAFSVPVQGPVMLAPARYAPPPPAVLPGPPKPRTFVPGQGEGGTFPWPNGRDYPREALDQHAQGNVMLYVVVDLSGVPVKVEVKDSSSYVVLDRFAAQWVKSHWRWLPGETRYLLVPWEFHLQ